MGAQLSAWTELSILRTDPFTTVPRRPTGCPPAFSMALTTACPSFSRRPTEATESRTDGTGWPRNGHTRGGGATGNDRIMARQNHRVENHGLDCATGRKGGTKGKGRTTDFLTGGNRGNGEGVGRKILGRKMETRIPEDRLHMSDF